MSSESVLRKGAFWHVPHHPDMGIAPRPHQQHAGSRPAVAPPLGGGRTSLPRYELSEIRQCYIRAMVSHLITHC